jgi:hypothetical protein
VRTVTSLAAGISSKGCHQGAGGGACSSVLFGACLSDGSIFLRVPCGDLRLATVVLDEEVFRARIGIFSHSCTTDGRVCLHKAAPARWSACCLSTAEEHGEDQIRNDRARCADSWLQHGRAPGSWQSRRRWLRRARGCLLRCRRSRWWRLPWRPERRVHAVPAHARWSPHARAAAPTTPARARRGSAIPDGAHLRGAAVVWNDDGAGADAAPDTSPVRWR